jgi:hypothetical protein
VHFTCTRNPGLKEDHVAIGGQDILVWRCLVQPEACLRADVADVGDQARRDRVRVPTDDNAGLSLRGAH